MEITKHIIDIKDIKIGAQFIGLINGGIIEIINIELNDRGIYIVTKDISSGYISATNLRWFQHLLFDRL